ncbi:MAG: GMC family oxidoreductase, partial [Deltaproteobacteria bacterium]|nr:GMC family oxidoreductase [Deltaproteobacteria bacterium]
MARLSAPIENLKPHYTVVVVGSGYGGAIAASRLGRAGQRVCVLERGKEFQPGEYPNTETTALREMQVDAPEGHLGSRTGLYDLHVNKDIHVFVGCGLGGTSLVNANVALRAEPRVFDDPRWPQALRDDLTTALADGYRRAEEMLKPTPYPDDFPTLPKLQALEKSAAEFDGKFYRPPINVMFAEGVNHVGVEQHTCTLCGDCVSGCNYGAKNTVLMNYLPDAKNHGAEIYTQVSVRRIERKENRWLVHYELLDVGREKFAAPTLFVSADIVILAAGTLGSTEILLRSGAAGLSLSDQLGQRFTGNGDVLAFGYNNDETINGIGFGHHQPDGREPVGPCISGIIDLRHQSQLQDGMVIEEGSLPGAISAFLPPAFAAAAKFVGKETEEGSSHLGQKAARELDSLVRGAYHGAMQHTQTYLVMSHDDGAGRLYLDDDRLRIAWPSVGKQPSFQRVNERLEQATRPLGGTYIKNPVWSTPLNYDLITVHPLGGCAVAEDAARGVVNHKGQVFADTRGATVHDGLYVCDGAVIPRSLGVNPLLTISALAERTCALLAKDRGWTINYDLSTPSPAAAEPRRLGLRFTETMRGYFSTTITDDYQRAAQQGQKDGSTFEFTLTVIADDLERMLSEQNHAARIVGSVTAPALSPHPLTVSAGEFNLFDVDPQQAKTRRMCYRMQLVAEDGAHYFFEGFKLIHDDPGFDLWADTTTLYVTVHRGDSAVDPVVGKGILTIATKDFARQLTTIQVTNAANLTDRLKALGRFA